MPTKRPAPSLKEFSDDLGRFTEDMQKETDRGVALVSRAFSEQLLESILRAKFIDAPKVVNEMLMGDSPLGTFSAKIKLCFVLGWIKESERDDFERIREIANYFAHSHKPASFDEATVRDRCALMAWAEEGAKRGFHARDQFIMSTVLLLTRILVNFLNAEHAPCVRGTVSFVIDSKK